MITFLIVAGSLYVTARVMYRLGDRDGYHRAQMEGIDHYRSGYFAALVDVVRDTETWPPPLTEAGVEQMAAGDPDVELGDLT